MFEEREKIVFTGNSNKQLAKDIAQGLEWRFGNAHVKQFSDGETAVELHSHVRDADVYIIQSVCSPANDNLMELIQLADATLRSSAHKVVAVIPYFGYARQDRRPGFARVPISARIVADMLQNIGIKQVIACDLHVQQIQGFFHIPVINASSIPTFTQHIWQTFDDGGRSACIVSPDTGGVVRARALAKQLDNHNLAIIDKRRPKANVSEVMNIIGDVDGCDCIIFDDMVDTAGTLCKAASALKEHGARSVSAYATHGVLSGPALENIDGSELDKLVITDTIPLGDKQSDRIEVVSIASLLTETIYRVATGNSVSALYSGI